MDQILDAPVNTNNNFQYAGFWIRTAAYLIDAILVSIVNVSLSYALFGSYNMVDRNVPLTLISTVLGIIYFCGMESSARQATLGKMVVGIKVGDLNGDRISFGNAFGRYFAEILSALILGFGFFMAGWDPKKQALHDRLAGTYVFYA